MSSQNRWNRSLGQGSYSGPSQGLKIWGRGARSTMVGIICPPFYLHQQWKKGEKTINLFKFLRKLITLCTNLVFLAQVYVQEEKWYTQVEEKNIYIEPHFEAEKMLTHSISIPLNFIAMRQFVKASHGLC